MTATTEPASTGPASTEPASTGPATRSALPGLLYSDTENELRGAVRQYELATLRKHHVEVELVGKSFPQLQ